ncbi:MAG: glycosyltransferase [Oscillospiraceae bacterium]|nr:glycosyltransferase [Oscillospiraceae bacterium]
MKVAIMIPSYKEAENLEYLLPKIHDEMKLTGCEYTITVIDSIKQTDDTKQVCDKNGAIYLPRRGSDNYGDAVRTGIEDAKADYIVFMDADGSHDPKYLQDMLAKVKNNDMVIGSRYMKGGHTDNNVLLVLMSKLLNMTYNILFGLKVRDVSNSLRVYSADKIKSLILTCQNFDIIEEIIIKMSLEFSPLSVAEVPITFNKRQFGNSKRSFIKFVFSYFATLLRLLRYKISFKTITVNSER